MSYDFYLVKSVGGDALAAARALMEDESEEINPGPPVPEKEARKEALAKALIELNPKLERFAFGFSEIAKRKGITEDEARQRYRHIELNGPHDGNGIQITLYDDTADLTVPYWHDTDAARIVFSEIWAYLETLASHDFVTYDPQLDKLLDLARDRDPVLATYGGVVAQMPDMMSDAHPQGEQPKKPWWKLW